MNLFENENDFSDALLNYFNLKAIFDDDAFEYPLKNFIYLLNKCFGEYYLKLIENELKNAFVKNSVGFYR